VHIPWVKSPPVRPMSTKLLRTRTLARTVISQHGPLTQVRFHGGHHEHPGHFHDRDASLARDYNQRPFTVGIGGPVGSGKTAMVLKLCMLLRDRISLGVVTNDIFTREDCEFLVRNGALPEERVAAVETGGCPHAAIREDISGNIAALEKLAQVVKPKPEVLLCESGGDNLAANFSRELSDYTIYVIDVAGGDKVPRKGGPGVTQSDLLVINKTDLAEAVGSDLDVMDRDAKMMRGDGPTVFAAVRHGRGVDEIARHILKAQEEALGQHSHHGDDHRGHHHQGEHHGHSHGSVA